MRALVVTWASGGNLPPLLAVAEDLSNRGLVVDVLASGATRVHAARRGMPMLPYRTAPEPDQSVPFELIAAQLSGQAAGLAVARDVLDTVRSTSPDLLVADCMLPAALAAGEAAGVPTASVVHFPYALARAFMTREGDAWTTDRPTLDTTRRELGLQATASALDAWESPKRLLVTLPRWFDAPGELPAHVVHAGPLGIRGRGQGGSDSSPPRALLSFSTTVMQGQKGLVANVVAAVEVAGLAGMLTLGPALPRGLVDPGAAVDVVEWAEHDVVMPSCDLVVTHGGLGTTLRALAHGRPQLVLPLGRDQHFNASRVAELGAGLTLPADAPAAEIALALQRLVAEPSYRKRAAELAEAIAVDRADARACDALLDVAS